MTEREQATLIEGVGNDVVYVVFYVIAGLIPIMVLLTLWQRQRSINTIHPNSEEEVNNTRQRIQQQNNSSVDNGTTSSNRSQTSEQQRRSPHRDRDSTCPICMDILAYGVETNCGHLFCGSCIITYWRHGNWLGAIICPVCRQQVTVLLKHFTAAEEHDSGPGRTTVTQEVNRYNRRFSGQPIAWLDYIRDLPTLLRHLWSEFFTVGGLIWMFRLRIILCFSAALIYLISPLDIIPEAVFGVLGLLDDVLILLLLAIYVSIIYRRYLANRV